MFQSDLFPVGEQLPSEPLAYAIGARIAELLASGRHLTRTDISGLFAAETGVLDWGSAWTIDDYNNAVEIGALIWLRESSRIDLATNVHEAEARFDWLEAALPPRHVRSEAQVELQQFSTPPMLAWLMAKATAISAQDTLVEPSAGNGALALWGSVQNASLLLNEIDPARRDGLSHIFPSAAITAHDAELIADLLRTAVESCATKLLLANPAFNPNQYAELFQLNEMELQLLGTLLPRQQVLLKRSALTKVLTLTVDPKSYWIYTNTPVDNDRVAAMFRAHGFEMGLDRLIEPA